MTSAAVLFYGRRSRSSRSFDSLGFGSSAPSPLSSSSSSSSSCDPSSSSNSNSSNQRNHRRRKGDSHRRHRHINSDDPDKIRHSSCGIESHQRRSNGETTSRDINDRETMHGLSGRYHRNNRLPGSVLLAKERLVQRLRGVSVSGTRDDREPSPNIPSNDRRVVDADWETNVLTEDPAYTIVTEPTMGSHQQSTEPLIKPLGLTNETLSQLHHEVFMEPQYSATHPMPEVSNECSICLESFVEGNKLINLLCGHRFHSSCLYPWLKTCGECPYCRSCIMLTS